MKKNLHLIAKSSLAMICFLFLLIPGAGATHLVGGSITYRFVSKENGFDRYEIKVHIYRDCNSSTLFDATIDVGFYENIGSKSKYTTLTLPLRSRRPVNPPSGGSNCSFKPPSCLEEGYYSGYINLPPSQYGWHMLHLRCCRNTMVNVPDEEGQTYSGFIPASSLANTSPYFTDVPAPYICAFDSVSLLYTAAEPDGDSLVYRLAHPYDGGSKDDPIPGPPLYYSNPPLIQYNGGYSYQQPFGSSGLAKIDPHSGLMKLYGVTTGLYAIAVDVDEYRNGVKISTTRRDIQIIVTNCPPNPRPERAEVDGSKPTAFYINAGDLLEFDIKYVDPPRSGQTSGESVMTVEYSGEVFDANQVNPTATLNNLSGDGEVTSHFKWQTNCKQGRSQPYVFSLKVTDKGCPPKTLNQTFAIYVKPYVGAKNIYGPDPACQGGAPYIYTADVGANGNNKFIWQVTGGKVVMQEGNAVHIIWDKVSKGYIKLAVESNDGCTGDTVFKIVTVHPRPVTPPISGPKVSCLQSTEVYSLGNSAGSKFYWEVEGGQQVSGGLTNTIGVRWEKKDSVRVRVVEVNQNGCPGDTMELGVFIDNTDLDRIYGSLSVCPNSKGIDYWVTPRQGSSYNWKVSGGTQVDGGNSSMIKVDWGEAGGGIISVVEVTEHGCTSDTVKLQVLKDYVLFTSPIQGDTVMCEYTKGVPYEVVYSNGSKYNWSITGGTIVSGQGTASILVDWNEAGMGALSVTETAYDSVNDKPCIGQPVVLAVRLSPIPATSDIMGPDEICEGDVVSYKVKGLPGSKFVWRIDGILQNSLLDSLVYVKQDMVKDEDIIMFQVTEVSADSCIGASKYLSVKVHKLPVTSDIEGSQTVCFPNLNGKRYSVKPSTASSFRWEVDGGSITSGAGTHEILVDWFVSGEREVRVTEINEFGCEGETVILPVNVDSLYLEMQVVTTSLHDDRQIEVHWTKKNDHFADGYIRIYRSEAGEGDLKLIDSVPASANVYIDRNVETHRYSYRYKVVAVNSCGTPIETNIHRSILLTHQGINDSMLRVKWNHYEGWAGGVDYYYLFRSMDEDTARSLYDLSKDTSLEVITSLEGYRHCYRIKGLKSQGDSLATWSNKVCIDLEPRVYIPNAFTPGNGDFLNGTFRIFPGNYKSFSVVVYNRWGERLFSSTDPEVQWDGTFNGKECPEGVYLYMVTVKGAAKNLYKNGTLHLMR